MERSHLLRNVALFLGVGCWIFLLLAFLGFNATDWPSHAVDPSPPTQNMCGTAGAFVAYWCFYAAGQGVFPVLFFLGAFLAILLFKGRVSDLWMRALGLVLLATAFAATVHHMEAKQGGTFRMSFRNFTTGQGHSFGGEYLELVPNEKLRYTDKFDDPNLPGQMNVTVTLKKVMVGTELTVVQEGIPDMIPVEMCYLGWQQSLENLAKLVEPEINQ